jgi:photosystem II stability/assembly factor-like uncharacterized protein
MPNSSAAAAATLLAAFSLACSTLPGARAPLGEPRLTEQASGTSELLQAVSPVDANVVWVSGHGGTWGRTLDGGATWQTSVMAGADTLEFRDVHAEDANTGWLLSAGPGTLSRIYHTGDAGQSWTLQWVNEEPAGFYDCLDFWDERRGFVYGDAVDGGLRILVTDDGGATWSLVPQASLPPAQPGEGGFAASGTCAITGADGRGWVAAGNATRARVFRTSDYGRSWEAAEVPVVGGEGAGLTTISMRDAERGVAFGGHLGEPENAQPKWARTQDGGRTWSAEREAPLPGAIYGGLLVPGTDGRGLVTVGPGGASVSLDGGATWRRVDERSWWGVGSAGTDATWISGPGGRIARVRLGG